MKIVSQSFPLIGEVDEVSISINSFEAQPGGVYPVTVYVKLKGPSAKPYDMNMTIPAEIVSNWVDDQVIVDYVFNQLGLVADISVEETPEA